MTHARMSRIGKLWEEGLDLCRSHESDALAKNAQQEPIHGEVCSIGAFSPLFLPHTIEAKIGCGRYTL
jgi:hypothetical protein